MLADGESYSTIEATVPCYRDYINRWRRRFLADRLAGLRARYRGQPPSVLTPAMEARVLAKTQEPPPDGSTHWSTRKLGRVLKIHHNLKSATEVKMPRARSSRSTFENHSSTWLGQDE